MMKMALFFVVALFLSVGCGARAQEELFSEDRYSELTEALPPEAEELLGDVSPSEAAAWGQQGLDELLQDLKENGLGILRTALRSGAMLLTIVLLFALVSSGMGEGGPKDAAAMCASVAISALAIDNVNTFIGLGISTVNTLSDFSKALLPTLCAAAVSAGAYTSASAKYAASSLFMDVLLEVGKGIIQPLIGAYLAMIIAGAALGRDSLDRAAQFLKWICTTAMTGMILAFTGYLSLTGIISGKADEMAARVTKTAIGTLLPVVGSAVSQAAGTLVAGAGMVRDSIGIFGLLAVAAVCLVPFLKLGAHYIVYKGAAALTEALTDKRMGRLIGGVGTAFGMMLGLVGASGAILFLSVVSAMKAVGAV